MGMGMDVSFQFLRGMGTGMGVIFENGYGCGYNSTHPEPAPLPFLIKLRPGHPLYSNDFPALRIVNKYPGFIFLSTDICSFIRFLQFRSRRASLGSTGS